MVDPCYGVTVLKNYTAERVPLRSNRRSSASLRGKHDVEREREMATDYVLNKTRYA